MLTNRSLGSVVTINCVWLFVCHAQPGITSRREHVTIYHAGRREDVTISAQSQTTPSTLPLRDGVNSVCSHTRSWMKFPPLSV